MVKASRRPWFVESLGSRFLWSMRGWGRTERVEPWMGGLRWHAMRVGRLLRSSEGVGAESHRVTGPQGHFRGVAGSRAYRSAYRACKQAGWWRRGTNGAARLTRADTTCDETMLAWQASLRAGRRGARRRGIGRHGLGRRGARRGGPGGGRGGTWVGDASTMRVKGWRCRATERFRQVASSRILGSEVCK